MRKRKIYSDAGWKWLLTATAKVKNTTEQAQLIYIVLKPLTAGYHFKKFGGKGAAKTVE